MHRSITAIARDLAAALLEALAKRNAERIEEERRIAALEGELCAAYRAEIGETIRI
jgi:hypothetical protein